MRIRIHNTGLNNDWEWEVLTDGYLRGVPAVVFFKPAPVLGLLFSTTGTAEQGHSQVQKQSNKKFATILFG